VSAIGFLLASYTMYPVQSTASKLIVRLRKDLPVDPPIIILNAATGEIDTAEMNKHLGSPVKNHWKGVNKFELCAGLFLLMVTGWVIYKAPIGFFLFVIPFLGGGYWLSHIFNWRAEQRYSSRREGDDAGFIDRWMATLNPTSRLNVITFIVLLGMLTISFGVVQDTSFNLIGFRKQNASVRMVPEDFKFLLQQSARAGIAVNPCEPLYKDEYVLHNADVLWYKLGTQGLLRYPTERIGEEKVSSLYSIRMEPLSVNINVLQMAKTGSDCNEYITDALFNMDASGLSASAASRLQRELGWLRDFAVDQKVQLMWHDSVSVAADEKAGILKKQRVAALKEFLMRTFSLPSTSILFVDSSNAYQKLGCEQNPVVTHEICDRINRRVQIQRISPD
jgi:hypothetical protein